MIEKMHGEDRIKLIKAAKEYGYVDLFATAETLEDGFVYLKEVLENEHNDKILIITAYQRIINKLAMSLAILQKRYMN